MDRQRVSWASWRRDRWRGQEACRRAAGTRRKRVIRSLRDQAVSRAGTAAVHDYTAVHAHFDGTAGWRSRRQRVGWWYWGSRDHDRGRRWSCVDDSWRKVGQRARDRRVRAPVVLQTDGSASVEADV